MSSVEMEAKLKFEDALKKIEQIVNQLESGKLTLEESLEQFQQGISLVKICHQDLEQVEQKIELMINSEAGEISLKEVNITEIGEWS